MAKERPAAQNLVVEDVVEFLRKVPPFQFLEDPQMRELAGCVALEYYPTGAVILAQEGPPSENLLVIKKGGAKVSVSAGGGEETLVDYRAEGDVIGFLSLYAADRSRTTVTATQDTICYRIGQEVFHRLLDTNPGVREYLHQAFLRKYLDRTLHEMQTRSLFVGGGERLLFTTPVGELAVGPVATAPAGVSIQAAADLMSRRQISSLVLVDEAGSPVGMLTDRDIREKVIAAGRSVAEPAGNVMTPAVHRVDATDYCFEALLTMIRHGIHHVLVMDGGRLSGIITNHDLMILQGTSPLAVAREIEYQQDLPGLAQASAKVTKIVELLLKEGAAADIVTHVVTELNDRIVGRVLEFAERRAGPPPVKYAWLALGSEGRSEQVFRTDQDNALLYDDPADPAQAQAAAAWAERFTAFARDTLVACGFPPCPGGFMAANPLWRQPLSAWRRYFSDWIASPAGDGPLQSMIFFDFRVAHGDFSLGERLRDHVLALLAEQRVFFSFVANQVAMNRPPIGFFRTFLVERSGEHRDQFNLKARGMNPIIDMVRLFALEKGLRQTGTVERIAALREQHTVVADYAEELTQAFSFLLLLRAHSQYRELAEGAPLDNFVDPHRLTSLEKRTVREAFQLVSRLQDQVLERYKASIL
jgi:CBS domain-containing protein